MVRWSLNAWDVAKCSLTQENNEELERCQKIFSKLVLKEKYKNYEYALKQLNLDSLHSRRQFLCEKFAKSGIKHKKLDDLFPENNKKIKMETRNQEKFVVQFANTERLKKSSIVSMQRQLNTEETWWKETMAKQQFYFVLVNYSYQSHIDCKNSNRLINLSIYKASNI